jgi:protein SCO1/2
MKASKITLLFLLLVLPAIMYFYLTRGYNNFIKLEIIGEADYSIDDFSFINQDSVTITRDSLLGSIYVANFFFTSCPTICPTMTRNMSYLPDKLSVYPNIRFLSHTVDPYNDTPDKLSNYVNLMQQKNISIDLTNWDFVTGDKDKLHESAANYFVNASVDSLAPGGFLHSEYFILIDKQGRVRSGIDINGNVVGAYDGTNEVQMKDLINDINVLMAEYKRPLKDAKD